MFMGNFISLLQPMAMGLVIIACSAGMIRRKFRLRRERIMRQEEMKKTFEIFRY